MSKVDDICKVLLMPIYCEKECKEIKRVDNKIITSQKYLESPDPDMSDISIGFYEIIYKDILNFKHILTDNGTLLNDQFAGDTMNSFNTIANRTEGAGKSRKQRTPTEQWPKTLQEYYNQYHCLANFWLLPKQIGRTLNGDMNKAKLCGDYMDRFLEKVHLEINFDKDDEYFARFKNWQDFNQKHFLNDIYVNEKFEVNEYSNNSSEETIEKMMEKIRLRANNIAKSKYANELWEYFSKYNL